MKSFKRVLTLLLLFTTCVSMLAQTKIEGHVTDGKSKEPLVGATIEVVDKNIKTIADVDGNFSITGLQNGKYRLLIKYVSYKDVYMNDVVVSSTHRSEEHTSELQSRQYLV